MKEKMTIALFCAFIIGLAYYSNSSIESSLSEEEVSSEIPSEQFEVQQVDFIVNDTSEIETMGEVNVKLLSMNTCVLEKMDTDLLSFSEAFGYFRNCLGSDSSFQWKGSEYTTLLSEEVIINVADSVQVEEKSSDNEISQIR